MPSRWGDPRPGWWRPHPPPLHYHCRCHYRHRQAGPRHRTRQTLCPARTSGCRVVPPGRSQWLRRRQHGRASMVQAAMTAARACAAEPETGRACAPESQTRRQPDYRCCRSTGPSLEAAELHAASTVAVEAAVAVGDVAEVAVDVAVDVVAGVAAGVAAAVPGEGPARWYRGWREGAQGSDHAHGRHPRPRAA